MWIRRAALLPLLILPSACPQRSPRSPAELAASSTDGGTAAPARLSFSVREHLLDGGVEPIELQPNDRTPIEPTQQIELSTNIPLRNYRIRVLDEADRALISDDVAQSTGERLDYRIFFHEPLKPGRRYTLVLDAETGSSFSDPDGAPQPDQRLEFQVTGEREKPPPTPSKRKKVRRR